MMNVDPLLTLVILVTGVVGGLVVVILVIIFCKYHLKRKVTLRRRQVVERERPRDLPQLKPLLRRDSPDSISIKDEFESDFQKISPKLTKKTQSSLMLRSGAFLQNGNDSEMISGPGPPNFRERTDSDTRQSLVISETNLSESSSESGDSDGFMPCAKLTEDDDYRKLDSLLQDEENATELPRLNDVQGAGANWSDGSEDELVTALVASLADHQRSSGSSSESGQTGQKQILVEVYDQPQAVVTSPTNVESRKIHKIVPKQCLTQSLPHTIPSVAKHKKACHSKSADVVQMSRATRLRETRKYFSYDDAGTYDNLRITEFNCGPFYNVDIVDESAVDSVKACVRYNDPGSIERLDEHFEFYEPDTSDSREDAMQTLSTSEKKYRDIWLLRATFEEEEECSDTIRLQDTTSPEPSPDEGIAKSAMCDTTSPSEAAQMTQCMSDGNCPSPPDTLYSLSQSGVDSCVKTNNNDCVKTENTDSVETDNNGDVKKHCDGIKTDNVEGVKTDTNDVVKMDNGESNLLNPSSDITRVQKPRCIFKKKLQSRGNSADTSFDSFDNVETDGDVSDTTSRHGFTTSFDSTDNTDSTTDSRLKKMRGDSGYKSIENPQIPGTTEKKLSFSLDVESYEYEPAPEISPKHSIRKDRRHSYIERSGKTASKRRREYRREPHALQLYESIKEPEEFLPKEGVENVVQGQSAGNNIANKFSVFSRFFRSHNASKSSRMRSLQRDYSMDETTSKLFNEFIRVDAYPSGETCSTLGSYGKTLGGGRRPDRLAPETRSASDSSVASRRLSPQESIEEEEYDPDHATTYTKSYHAVTDITSHATIHEIPIIKLPDEELV